MLRWLLVSAFLALASHAAFAQQPVVQCWQTESTTTPPRTNCLTGVPPVSTTTSASSLVLKTTAGTLLGLDIRNNTATALNVLIFDAASVPTDGGGKTPKLCKRVAASSDLTINPIVGIGFGTGIVVALSTSGDCYTKTTGASDAFMSGVVQ